MIFDFESDFAGSLHCIPMIARQKLDLVGIKLSLRQWNRFSREDREELVALPCRSGEERRLYRERVLERIEARTDEPPVFLEEQSFDEWMEGDQMPDAVCHQAEADRVEPPAPERWAALSPLQRFALIKLARSKHENENFVPAMREFGILP